MLDVLQEPLIRVATKDGQRRVPLPEVYALAVQDHIDSFPALRAHHRYPWHAFLAQLGALALHRGAVAELPETAKAWHALLQSLTSENGGDTAWHLVVEDAQQPAFLQPPLPVGERLGDKTWKTVNTPDGIDLLVTTKNHDLKLAVALDHEPDDWLFALLSLQTMGGYGGGGNYGVSRMNGGYGGRWGLGLAPPEGGFGARLARDIRMMLECRQDALDRPESMFQPEDGHALLWLLPWDGSKNQRLPMESFDPWYIEVCRRIRLAKHIEHPDRVVAKTHSSNSTRIDTEGIAGGITGDPWTPIDAKAAKVFSLSSAGFHYSKMSAMLFGVNSIQPFAAQMTPAEQQPSDGSAPRQDWHLVAQGMATGQGKTEGYHERVIPVSSRVAGAFKILMQERRQQLGELSGKQIKTIQGFKKILTASVAIFISGAEDVTQTSDDSRKQARHYTDRLDAYADTVFFDRLWRRFDAEAAGSDEADKADKRFTRELYVAAERLLQDATDGLPSPAIRRYRSHSRAFAYFHGVAIKQHPYLKRRSGGEASEESS